MLSAALECQFNIQPLALGLWSRGTARQHGARASALAGISSTRAIGYMGMAMTNRREGGALDATRRERPAKADLEAARGRSAALLATLHAAQNYPRERQKGGNFVLRVGGNDLT